MDPFAQFLQQRHKDLKRIARASRGEHTLNDVRQEAWLIAEHVAHKTGRPKDFKEPDFQSLLIAFLYQQLVRYTELNVRNAVRLDHAFSDDDEDGRPRTPLDKLAGDDGRDPLSYLLALETRTPDDSPSDATLLGTNAGAWAVFLRQCDNRMHTASMRLLISLSHAYHCVARTRQRATYQTALALRPRESEPRLGAWRKARYDRVPKQLSFDFDPVLELRQPA